MMNPYPIGRAALLFSLLLLSACSHEAPVLNMRQEQAIEFNRHAQHAFLRGEYQVAAGLYESALQLDSAIENVDGIAVNLLNLAKVNLALGKPESARQYLDSLLQDKALQYPPKHLAAAAAQYGILSLQAGDVVAAKTWTDKASTYCASDCKLSGVIANLRANIAIRLSDAEQAVYWGERAVAANKDESRIEYANALRLLAQARLLKQEFSAALPLLDEALVIDKTLGLPEKIQLDLSLLAQAQDKLGRMEAATLYRERAARIAPTAVK